MFLGLCVCVYVCVRVLVRMVLLKPLEIVTAESWHPTTCTQTYRADFVHNQPLLRWGCCCSMIRPDGVNWLKQGMNQIITGALARVNNWITWV